ncbi:flippase [Sulfurimonas sp. HSL3-7]|uniref:flippase n=1 Tax=Sulfonitrofixus jiaomeiensis TaxID=3131938 RepID=UPI0031F94F38
MIAKLKALKSHQGFMKYFKNTSWLFGEKILRMAAGLLIGVWIARYLGPEQFGLLSYAGAFVGLFSAVAALGLDNIIVRKLVKDETQRDLLLGTAFLLKIIGGVLVLLFLALAINLVSIDTYTATLIFIIASAMLFQSFNVIDIYFQSRVLSRYVVYANIISLSVSSIVKIVLILKAAPLIAFAFVVLFDSIVLALGFIYIYRLNHLSVGQWTFNSGVAVTLLKESWPLILSGIVVAVYTKVDQVMIKTMLGNEAVGQYAAAVRISEAWYFIPTVIAASIFPAVIHAKKQSETLYYARLQKLFDLMVWIAIAIALPMSFFSDWLIDMLYGSPFHPSASVLIVHIWTGVFVFLGVASSKWFIVEELQKLAFYRTFYGMLTNIILNLLLIKEFGIIGAAYATLISYGVAGFLFDFFNPKTRAVFYMKLNTLNIRKFFAYKDQ